MEFRRSVLYNELLERLQILINFTNHFITFISKFRFISYQDDQLKILFRQLNCILDTLIHLKNLIFSLKKKCKK